MTYTVFAHSCVSPKTADQKVVKIGTDSSRDIITLLYKLESCAHFGQ